MERRKRLHADDAGKRQTDTGKTETSEEDTPEKTNREKDIVDLADIPRQKQETPRKEEQGNGDGDEYLPTPREGPENSTQNDNRQDQEQENEEDERKSVASEQTGRTPTTEQSEVGKSGEIESEAGEKRGEGAENSGESEEEGEQRKKKKADQHTHTAAVAARKNKENQRLNIPERGKSDQPSHSART